METQPVLIENGTKYFLRETLKRCHKKNTDYFNKVMNISFLILFISILGTVLFYKYYTKLTPKEKIERLRKNKAQLLNKIRFMKLHRQKEQNKQITNLPQFESTFEMLHKQYYKI